MTHTCHGYCWSLNIGLFLCLFLNTFYFFVICQSLYAYFTIFFTFIASNIFPAYDFKGVGDNDFKAAMDAVDQQYLNDIISSSSKDRKGETDVSVRDDGTRDEDLAVSS